MKQLEPRYGAFIVEDRVGSQVVVGSRGPNGLFIPQVREMQPKGFRPLQGSYRVISTAPRRK